MVDVKIGRALFLKVRHAYIREMASRGDQPPEVMGACNVGDVGQVKLLASYAPDFGDGTCRRDLVALLRSFPREELEKLMADAIVPDTETDNAD